MNKEIEDKILAEYLAKEIEAEEKYGDGTGRPTCLINKRQVKLFCIHQIAHHCTFSGECPYGLKGKL